MKIRLIVCAVLLSSTVLAAVEPLLLDTATHLVINPVVDFTGITLTGTPLQTISITGDGTASDSTDILTLAVTSLNGTSLAGLTTGLLKNTTSTGVPSIAVAGTDYDTPSFTSTLTNKTISGSSNTITNIGTSALSGSAVTYAKIQNVSANSKLLGSGSTGSGAAPSEITLGTGLSMSGTTLNGSAADASTNTSSSVDSEIALFSSTTGKLLKRATGSGIAKITSGVLSAVTAPSGAIVGDTDTQTETNKTITSPLFNTNARFTNSSSGITTLQSGATGTNTLTLPAISADTLVALTLAQTLTNKTLQTPSLNGNVTITGGGSILINGGTSGTTTLSVPASASGTITFPNGTDTVAVIGGSQTLSNKTLQTPTINGSATITGSGSLIISGSTSGTNTLSATASASGTMTIPNGTDTLVGKATTDTLTNKTLTSPALTTPTIGGGTAISSVYSNSGSIDWTSIAAGGEQAQSLTVTGAATTNTPSVILGWNAALEAGIVVKQARVSATNTVSIILLNTTAGAIDPAAVTVRATVTQF